MKFYQTEDGWVNADRVYIISVGAHSCTLYCEDCNIGSYYKVGNAKRAANRHEASGRPRVGKPMRY